MLTKQPITKKMNVPAAKAWDAISKIGRLDVWFSFLDSCRVEGTGPGAHRYLTIANNGGSIHDIITEIDELDPILQQGKYEDYAAFLNCFSSKDCANTDGI